jgi:hypothetical protein
MFLGPGGKRCESRRELLWSFEQQFKEPFVVYVGQVCLERKNPRFFDGVSAPEQKIRCVKRGRAAIDKYVGQVAPCEPPVPWDDLIYKAAAEKGEPDHAAQIIHFFERIFVVPHARITPQEGLSYFLSIDEDFRLDERALSPVLREADSPRISTWPGAERNSKPRPFYRSAPTRWEPFLEFDLGEKEVGVAPPQPRSLLNSSAGSASSSEFLLLEALRNANL